MALSAKTEQKLSEDEEGKGVLPLEQGQAVLVLPEVAVGVTGPQ